MPDELLRKLLLCEKHGCPMIMARGRYVCAFDHVLTHLDGKQLKSVRLDIAAGDKRTTWLVFVDGHVVPLLTAQRSGYEDVESVRHLCGLYLVGVTYIPPVGKKPEGLTYVFHPDAQAEVLTADSAARPLTLHLDSAKKLWCPSISRPSRRLQG